MNFSPRRVFATPVLTLILIPSAVVWSSGCSTGPRLFRGIDSPAAANRARAIGMGDRLPDRKVIPKLLERLNDTDEIVRITAHGELRKRTGQDFGFVPWAPLPERAVAAERWNQWWFSVNQEPPSSSLPLPLPSSSPSILGSSS